MTHTAYLGLGSNVGDRAGNIGSALEALEAAEQVEVTAVSPLRETVAMGERGPSGQPPFINAAAKIRTSLDPQGLLSLLISIERSLGRPHPRPKGHPRTIDLDILLFDDLVLDAPGLKIPHPGLAKRVFVLSPLCDIAPELTHPELNVTVRELLLRCSS